MHKFYTLEDMTQEDLNKLALERNTLDQELNKYKSIVDGINEHIDKCLENDKYCYLSSEPKDRCRIEIWGEVKDKIKELEEGNSNG